MKYLMLSILFIFASCSSKPKNYRLESYEERPVLKQSFFEQKLTPAQVNELLQRKVALPKELKLAVIKLGHEWDLTTMTDSRYQKEQDYILGEENTEVLNNLQGKNNRIREVAIVPPMMLPNDKSIESLRNVAALMQAELLVVVRTKSRTDSKFRMFHKDEVKTIATVEAMVVDVRTGVIPYTTIASESYHLKENKDLSYQELYLKSSLKAEDKALAEVFRNVGEYFNR